MPISTSLANSLLNHVLRATTYTSPTSLKVGLYTVLPNAAGTGGTEVSGGAYARQTITFNAASSNQAANTALVTFPTATADWGTVVGVAIFDQADNLLFFGSLNTPTAVYESDVFKIPAGYLIEKLV